MTWSTNLQSAQSFAQKGDFNQFLALCQQIVDSCSSDAEAILSVGVLLINFGFLAGAKSCFLRVNALLPKDIRPIVNLANLARDSGDHTESRRLYSILLQHFPDNPIIRRNILTSLEYDPSVSDKERLDYAKAWGEWAIAKAGGLKPRPPIRLVNNAPLRVGYVSADFCQHTVGLFVKEILASHNPETITVFAYSAGAVKDWLTNTICKVCQFRDVSALDDIAFASLIRQDKIDILIDLSGHTAGSRLTVFAHRPAPIQLSWLGYFATTGLGVIDGVILDKWHAPEGTESQFVEPIIRLESGRFFYAPVPFAPSEVSPLPCIKNGYITFGSFNNTAKLNSGVFDLWAEILSCLPDSRLILKWRTFHDLSMCQTVKAEFAKRGVSPERLELRGFSFHVDLLKEYGDIDIALDPFPFTGGLTSCEALWMGVPVVTFPQERVVSRQTFAILSAIGLSYLAATDEDDYVRIAVELAKDVVRLEQLRKSMRKLMRESVLMDVGKKRDELFYAFWVMLRA